MESALTPAQALDVFHAVAARVEEIAFRWLEEGCECRAQLMVEQLQDMGLAPGRAWVLAVGRPLIFRRPSLPERVYRWGNHVAPTVPVDGVEYGKLVINPSLSA